MKLMTKTILLLNAFFLISCSIQDPAKKKSALEKATLAPVIQPCEKITALLNEYDNDFDGIKLNVINTRISKTWRAKYHLLGNDCQIWAQGNKKTTYACNTATANEQVARNYFDRAKNTARRCLDDSWQMQEQARKNNNGYKVEFHNKKNKIAIAVHMVPTARLFKSEWTVYYYIGNANQSKQSQ